MTVPASGQTTGSLRPWAAGLAIALVAAVGVAISLAAAVSSYRASRELEQLRFTQQSEGLVNAVENAIAAAVEKVRAEGDFIRSHPDLSAETFATFARPAIARLPQIHSMTWVEAVPDAERAAWEARLRADVGGEASIIERGADGEPTGAATRPRYYPVRFIEPVEEGRRALGYDTGSSADRRAAMERARDTGEPAATAMVSLMGDSNPQPSFVLFVPVYRVDVPPGTVGERRASLVGFATAGFRVAALLQRSLRASAAGTVHLHLFDVTGDTPEGLASWPGPGDGTNERPDPGLLQLLPELGGPSSTHDLPFAGRVWRVVAAPGPRYIPADPGHGWIVLGAGVCFTALSSLLLAVAFRRNTHLRTLAHARALHAARLQREVADREAAQHELACANDELRQLNVEMEQFVSAVSHDLKNPLLAIEWTNTSLRASIDAGHVAHARQGVETIGKAATSMRRIIDDLLAHARAGWSSYKPEPVDLRALIDHLLDERADDVRRCGARVEVVGDLPVTTADKGRLTTAIDNLLGNALKYGCSAAEPRVRIGCDPCDDEVRLFVEDNGSGIQPEHRERVFKLFQRLARDEDGTGIGLAIVDRVARVHRGRAWCDEAPGGGARFWLTFPRGSGDRPVAPDSSPATTYN